VQVSQDRGLGAGAVARAVEIVDAQQKFPTGQAGIQPGQQGGAQVAPVQGASGRGGEAPPVAQPAALSGRGQLIAQMGGQQRLDWAQGSRLSRPAPCP
jgi:hypothetical protein